MAALQAYAARLKDYSLPDGLGNQSWTYTPDGLPANISTHNSSGGNTVTNSYSYNRRRLPTQEAMTPDASQSWTLGYGYNANGHLTSHVYPAGLTTVYTVNALGQVTQVAAQDGSTVNVASNVAAGTTIAPCQNSPKSKPPAAAWNPTCRGGASMA